jgi:hypothetical protein
MFKKHQLYTILLSLPLLFVACNNPVEDGEVKLMIPTKEEIYFGAFPDFGGSEDQVSVAKIKDFEHLIEKKITWAYFSQNWFNGISYPKEAIHAIDQAGAIPFVRLMPRSTQEQSIKEEQFSLQKIIDGQFDSALRVWAREAKEDQIPLLIDFAVEPNGDWFGWSGALNGAESKDGYGDPNYYDGAERYRDAYRHIIDIFNEEDVRHVTWFFHADIHSFPNLPWNKPKLYYPGDAYIDWIGVSLYGALNPKEEWQMFDEILEEGYEDILDISSQKPIALLEFGVTDHHPRGSKALWLEGAFETILSGEYIDFKAISYWHERWEEEDGSVATIRLDSSLESKMMFKEYIQNPRFLSQGYFSE